MLYRVLGSRYSRFALTWSRKKVGNLFQGSSSFLSSVQATDCRSNMLTLKVE